MTPPISDLPSAPFEDVARLKLAERLTRLADVRSAVVARGRSLIAQPNYPDKATIRRVAQLLARHL